MTRYVGQITRPGQRPENCNLVIDPLRDSTIPVFISTDATPSVRFGSVFATATGALTITDFDDGYAGQVITVISKAAVTYDVTGTNLNGGTTDIVTADGDVTQWVCEDGTDWHLLTFMDASVDNS